LCKKVVSCAIGINAHITQQNRKKGKSGKKFEARKLTKQAQISKKKSLL